MRTILMIDDEAAMRKKYGDLLKKEGHKVIEAPDVLEVGNVLMREKSNLDLIILDINIPEVDGRGISEIVEDYAPEIPVLVASVIPLQDQKLKIPHAVDYYNKADTDNIFVTKVKNILGV